MCSEPVIGTFALVGTHPHRLWSDTPPHVITERVRKKMCQSHSGHGYVTFGDVSGASVDAKLFAISVWAVAQVLSVEDLWNRHDIEAANAHGTDVLGDDEKRKPCVRELLRLIGEWVMYVGSSFI